MKTFVIVLSIGVICLVVGYFVGSGALIHFLYSADAKKAEAYYDALGSVQRDAVFLVEFRRTFPGAVERVRYFTPGHEPGFDVVVHLHDRYELTMQLPVSFDVSGRRVVGYGMPTFYLNEVQKVDQTSSGTIAVSYNPAGALKFGPSEWRTIVEHNGDFASIGYKMVTDHPIPGFSLITIPK